MSFWDKKVVVSDSISDVVENIFVPHWKKMKIRDTANFTLRRLTNDEIANKKNKVLDWCKLNPKADRKLVYEFMRTI